MTCGDLTIYQHSFFGEFGEEGPWPCHFCSRAVTRDAVSHRDKLIIHHVNNDPTDNTVSNLAACHWGCHSSHTSTVVWQSGGWGNGRQKRNNKSAHWMIFIENYSSPPWLCHFCGKRVDGYTTPRDHKSAIIHHLDGNHYNNAIDNLVPCHLSCHSRYHASTATAETRAKISVSNTGREHTLETRAKMSASHPGPHPEGCACGVHRAKTEEEKAHLRKLLEGRSLSDEHRAKLSTAHEGFRHSEESRAKMSAQRQGSKHPMYGKHHTASSIASMKAGIQRAVEQIVICDECGQECRGNAGLRSHFKQKHEDALTGSYGLHIRWHINRGLNNPNCLFCADLYEEES